MATTLQEKIDFYGKVLALAENARADEGFYLTQSEITERAFLSKSQQYVLDFFTEKGDAKFADLLNFTGDLYAENTLRKAVQYLINEKLLERKDDGGQRVEAIYGIKRC